MAADTAIELKQYNVASISLWPGAVLTETIQASEHNARVYIIFCYSKEEKSETSGLRTSLVPSSYFTVLPGTSKFF